MFRCVERPPSKCGLSLPEFDPDEEKPYLAEIVPSDPTLDLLSLRQFCEKDSVTGSLSLRLCGNEISQPPRGVYGDADVTRLAQQLTPHRDIAAVDLSYNEVGDAGARAIADCLRGGWQVQRLNLMNNAVGGRGAGHLAAALAAGTHLTALRLNGNALGAAGGRQLAALLMTPGCTLQELDVGQTDQTISSVTALLTALRTNTSLQRLVLDRPLLAEASDEAADQLGRTLRANSTLTHLRLRKFHLTDDQLRLVCDGLAGNRALADLDLSANHLHRDAARHLAATLAENKHLHTLRLCHNRLETEGALWLAAGIREHGPRHELHLRSNGVRSDGLLSLLTELRYGRLRRLRLWGNPWCARVPAEVDVMWKTGVVDAERVDVRPYVVDYVPYLAQLADDDRQRYYNVTRYGDRSYDKVRIGYPV